MVVHVTGFEQFFQWNILAIERSIIYQSHVTVNGLKLSSNQTKPNQTNNIRKRKQEEEIGKWA